MKGEKSMECKQVLDIDEIQRVLEEMRDEPHMEVLKDKTFLSKLAKKIYTNGFLFASYKDNEVCGVISGYANDIENRIMFINLVAVKQSMGLASAKHLYELCERVVSYAEMQKMDKIRLEVARENNRARNHYEHIGFRYIEETEKSLFMITETYKCKEVLEGLRLRRNGREN